MQAAERKDLIQLYGAGDSSKAAPICGGCLALLALLVVLGGSPAGEDTTAPGPMVVAAAQPKPVSARADQLRKQTFEARRETFARDRR